MGKAIVFISIMIGLSALGDDKYMSQGREITKIEAVKLLITSPNAKVSRCYEVELSPNVTLRKRKESK